MKINIPQLGEPLVVTAKIVRHCSFNDRKGYWCGVKFLQISEEDQKKLADFIWSIKNKY
jgi:c-di-GMP-binding flagellar brake protein YcgR